MSTTITFFPVGDGDMMSRIISSVVAGVRRLPHEMTASSPATPIDHAALTAHDAPGPRQARPGRSRIRRHR